MTIESADGQQRRDDNRRIQEERKHKKAQKTAQHFGNPTATPTAIPTAAYPTEGRERQKSKKRHESLQDFR